MFTEKIKGIKNMNRKTFLMTIIFMLAITTLSAQSFTSNDKRIGDTTVNYVNPELSPAGNYLIWIEINTTNGVSGTVWQCGIDPNTGDLIPRDGKGFSPFYSNIYARPADWGIDSIGPYYVGATFAGQIKFVRPTSPTTATVTNISMPIMNKRRVFYPSQLPGINKRFVSYILNDSINGFSSNTPQNSYYQLRLLDLDNPANDFLIEQQPSIYPIPVPMDVIVPRWIKGSSYLTFGYSDVNYKAQVKEFNAFSPATPPVPVTNDLSNKIDGNSAMNPITLEQYFMGGINGTDTAYFYKRNSFGQIFIQNEIIVPNTQHLQSPSFNQSHEPFFFNGQLYSTFQINNNGGNWFETTFNQPGEIWMTTIDSFQQTMWLLSEYDSTLNISEPEPYIGNNKVWIYYSAVEIDTIKPYLKRQFQLRRYETPLNIATSIEDNDNITLDFKLYQNYPNPFNPMTKIEFILPKSENVKIEVFDILGRKKEVLLDEILNEGKHYIIFNGNNYASGIYFYRLTAGSYSDTKKLLLLR